MMCSKILKVDSTRAADEHNNQYTTWYMVMIPLGIYLCVFVITTLFVFIIDVPATVFTICTLLGLFICGVCTAVASSGIVGTAGLFQPHVGINPYFNGQAVGGLLVALANFLTSILNGSTDFILQYCTASSVSSSYINDDKSIINSDAEDDTSAGVCIPYSEVSWATAMYFGMSCCILAICMVGYSYVDQYKRLVRQNSFRGDSRIYSSISSRDNAMGNYESFGDTTSLEEDIDLDNDDENEEENQINNHKNPLLISQHLQYLSIEDTSELVNGPLSSSSRLNESTISKWKRKALVTFSIFSETIENSLQFERLETDSNSENSQSVTMSVWSSVKGPAVSLFFTYFCTLAIFPVWTSNLVSILRCQSSTSRIYNDLFTPLSFVIFNGGDLIGRSISSSVRFEKIPNLSNKLVWASLLRMGFFVLFLLCNAEDNHYRIVESDMYSWSIQFLFAVSNGFMTNIAFCYAPSLVENRTHPQQVASAILNFALSFGLLVGSFFSGPYLKIASGSRF